VGETLTGKDKRDKARTTKAGPHSTIALFECKLMLVQTQLLVADETGPQSSITAVSFSTVKPRTQFLTEHKIETLSSDLRQPDAGLDTACREECTTCSNA